LALASRLPKTQAGTHVANRLLHSGTAVGAKVQDLEWADSATLFLSTMQLALNEIREAGYWIRLLRRAKLLEDPSLENLEKKTQELTAILAKSIIPAKQKPPLP
jgi:four helix bundle protein